MLDVGCGTGTLAMEAASPRGPMRAALQALTRHTADRPCPLKSGPAQHAHRVPDRGDRATRLPRSDIRRGVFDLDDASFACPLKRQGLAEIARVLKPGGRLVIADFTHKQERQGQAARFHAGGSRMHDLMTIVSEAGFLQMKTEEMQPHASLLSQGQALSWHTKAKANLGAWVPPE